VIFRASWLFWMKPDINTWKVLAGSTSHIMLLVLVMLNRSVNSAAQGISIWGKISSNFVLLFYLQADRFLANI